jgi:hypothetical protein
MNGIGHNRGPTLEAGASWRSHCWRKARDSLLPVLPVEVVRARVRRAAELGLDYKTYAGVRATTGRDLIAFLFSSNALALRAPIPTLDESRAARLVRIGGAARIALVHRPLTPAAVLFAAPVLDAAHPAPGLLDAEAAIRADLRVALRSLPPGAVLLVGAHGLERDWCAAARLAGYLPADRFFATA